MNMRSPLRSLLFAMCMVTRAAIAYAAKRVSTGTLRAMGLGGLAVAVGFFTIYLMGWRETGIEAGGRIWWNSQRPVHGGLYLAFAMLALRGETDAWVPLAIDVAVGLAAYTLK